MLEVLLLGRIAILREMRHIVTEG